MYILAPVLFFFLSFFLQTLLKTGGNSRFLGDYFQLHCCLSEHLELCRWTRVKIHSVCVFVGMKEHNAQCNSVTHWWVFNIRWTKTEDRWHRSARFTTSLHFSWSYFYTSRSNLIMFCCFINTQMSKKRLNQWERNIKEEEGMKDRHVFAHCYGSGQ